MEREKVHALLEQLFLQYSETIHTPQMRLFSFTMSIYTNKKLFYDITSKHGFSLSYYSFTLRKDCSDLAAQYTLMDSGPQRTSDNKRFEKVPLFKWITLPPQKKIINSLQKEQPWEKTGGSKTNVLHQFYRSQAHGMCQTRQTAPLVPYLSYNDVMP